MELKKKTHFPKQHHHHQSITFWILKPATTTLKHSQIDTLEFKKKENKTQQHIDIQESAANTTWTRGSVIANP